MERDEKVPPWKREVQETICYFHPHQFILLETIVARPVMRRSAQTGAEQVKKIMGGGGGIKRK
jgi:hypothetical protein